VVVLRVAMVEHSKRSVAVRAVSYRIESLGIPKSILL
jgi:hypothetical protein